MSQTASTLTPNGQDAFTLSLTNLPADHAGHSPAPKFSQIDSASHQTETSTSFSPNNTWFLATHTTSAAKVALCPNCGTTLKTRVSFQMHAFLTNPDKTTLPTFLAATTPNAPRETPNFTTPRKDNPEVLKTQSQLKSKSLPTAQFKLDSWFTKASKITQVESTSKATLPPKCSEATPSKSSVGESRTEFNTGFAPTPGDLPGERKELSELRWEK
jgi:hypothetical protein